MLPGRKFAAGGAPAHADDTTTGPVASCICPADAIASQIPGSRRSSGVEQLIRNQ